MRFLETYLASLRLLITPLGINPAISSLLFFFLFMLDDVKPVFVSFLWSSLYLITYQVGLSTLFWWFLSRIITLTFKCFFSLYSRIGVCYSCFHLQRFVVGCFQDVMIWLRSIHFSKTNNVIVDSIFSFYYGTKEGGMKLLSLVNTI